MTPPTPTPLATPSISMQQHRLLLSLLLHIPLSFSLLCHHPSSQSCTHSSCSNSREREREMGNCQASEAATVVIQHPGGRVERLYWPTPAREVMQSHPGHYVAVCLPGQQRRRAEHHQGGSGGGTRVRLLRSKDTLLLGQVYRLVTSQEVVNALRARKQEKMRAVQMDLLTNHSLQQQRQQQQTTKTVAADEVVKRERGRQKAAQSAPPRQRHWRPSLQSISEPGN